jgi:hypothetical protein
MAKKHEDDRSGPDDDARDWPADADLASNDLESVDLVQCPRCHKFCLSDYANCPRCQQPLTHPNSGRKPLWFVLTVAVVLGLVILFWVLQYYAPARPIGLPTPTESHP